MTDTVTPRFGDLLRQARRTAGLTQEQLAERARLSVRGISDLERGLVRAPRRDTLLLLADALHLPATECQRWEELRRLHALRATGALEATREQTSPHGGPPTPLTTFVGREHDQTAIIEMLERPEVRLLTITGSGGVGKTRLAIAVAHQLSVDLPHCVTFVELAPVRSPDLVLTEIATTQAVRVSGTRSLLDALVSKFRQDVHLLVLDNMEHLTSAAPDISRLLAACPHLNLLVTSRSPLHIQGEWEYRLRPLTVPDKTQTSDLDQLTKVSAVTLFLQRARAVNPSFSLTADNGAAVSEICRRLDGLPLAIELAAARVRLLPPQALLQRMEPSLPLLVSANRDIPDRHQTLRATIEWSYNLLSADEQWLFRALSVFHGGWAFEAVESIVPDGTDALTTLESLIDQSFVWVHDQPDGSVRFGMLETIREYGLEQLETQNEVESSLNRHSAYVVSLVEQAESQFRGADQALWLGRLEDEHANLRAALRWSADGAQHGDTQAIVRHLRLVCSAWWFWYVHGHFYEGRDHLQGTIQMYRDARHSDTSLATSEEAALYYARALFGLASVAYWTINAATELGAERYQLLMDECLEIYRAVGQAHDLVVWLIFAGYAAQHSGHFARAEALLLQGIASARENGAVREIAMGHLSLGDLQLRQGNYEQGAIYARESEALFASINDERSVAAARATLAAIRSRQGNLEEARDLFQRSVRARAVLHDKGGIAWCLERMAELALADAASAGHPPMRAARLLGAANALRAAIGSPVDPVDVPEINQRIQTTQSRLSGQAFIAAWEAGRAMPWETAVEYALDVSGDEPPCTAPDHGLSKRELDVLKLLADGHSNQVIAGMLFISPYTVGNHVTHILNKLGVDSRTAAATWAVRKGLT